MKALWIVLAAAASLLCGCSSSERKPYFEEETSTYVAPEYDIRLQLPENPSWIIAPEDRLPENVIFCGIIPEYSFCAILVRERLPLENGLNPQSLIPVVSEIIMPEGDEVPALQNLEFAPGMDGNLGFNVSLNRDSLSVRYSGLIVRRDDDMLIKVAVQPEPIDSGENILAEEFLNMTL